MELSLNVPPYVFYRLIYEAVRPIMAILTLAAALSAQPKPASIATIDQPTSGAAVFDAAGNQYYVNGPVTPGAAQTQPGGGACYVATGVIGSIPKSCSDAHVVKVAPAGNVVYGTLFGGPTDDSASALAVDAAGNVFVTGSTGGSLITTSGAAVPASATAKAFAARLSADGSTFIYSTYLPDTIAAARAIAVDAQDNAYITGQSVTGRPYVIKLNPGGSAIVYNVSFASNGSGSANAVAIDAAGDAIVAGQTSARDFPVTPGALQPALTGRQNLFLAKLDPTGHVVFATYLGGSGTDTPTAVQTDSAGNIYVAGATSSLDFPTTPDSFQPAPIVPAWNNSSPAGFAAKLNSSGSALMWSTYVMSADSGRQLGVGKMTVTASGDVFLAGRTGAGFPVTPSAPQMCFSGFSNRTNGFVAHLNSQGALTDATYLGPDIDGNVDFVWGLSVEADSSVKVVWQSTGNDALSRIKFGSDGWTASPCLSTSVLNAATQSGNDGLAPGELITLTGFGIGPDTGVAYQPDAQGQIPRRLAGVQVFFDGSPVPVLYAQSRQINAMAPVELASKTLTTLSVTYNRQQFGPIPVPVTFGSPGIFRLQIGASAQAVAMNQDNTLNGASNPAARGSVVTIWTTGYGPTGPACATGGLNIPQPTGLGPGITAQIADGGVYNPIYAGSAPGLVCGIVQVNMRVPGSAAPGTYLFFPWVQSVQGNRTTIYEAPVGATIMVK